MATVPEIDRAFRKLARAYHPDKDDSEEAVKMFLALEYAHEYMITHLERIQGSSPSTATATAAAAAAAAATSTAFDELLKELQRSREEVERSKAEWDARAKSYANMETWWKEKTKREWTRMSSRLSKYERERNEREVHKMTNQERRDFLRKEYDRIFPNRDAGIWGLGKYSEPTYAEFRAKRMKVDAESNTRVPYGTKMLVPTPVPWIGEQSYLQEEHPNTYLFRGPPIPGMSERKDAWLNPDQLRVYLTSTDGTFHTCVTDVEVIGRGKGIIYTYGPKGYTVQVGEDWFYVQPNQVRLPIGTRVAYLGARLSGTKGFPTITKHTQTGYVLGFKDEGKETQVDVYLEEVVC
jgi:hypothetical protein